MTSAQPSWQNPRILVILSLIFVTGLLVGMVAMSLGAHRVIHPAQSSVKEPSKEVTLQRLKQELNLTPDQSEQLEMVLDDFFSYYHTLQGQLDDVRSSGKQRILRILNEDQKRKFDKLMTDFQSRKLQ